MDYDLNLYGFRRSGNHFLGNSIVNNFKVCKFNTNHINYNDYKKHRPLDIYIIRDGRDVMVAMWYWAQVNRYGKHLKKKDFSKYIRGQYRDWQNNQLTPLEDWIYDCGSWFGKIFTVYFEDLKIDQLGQLRKIESHFGLVRKRKKLTPLVKLVGHAPRKGIIGDHMNYFKAADYDYFWQKAGEVMEKYGYKK